MITRVVMPPLSETMDEGTVLRWLKQEGERVRKGEPLLEVESDKATLQVESFGSGVLRRVLVGEGETAPVGRLLGVIAEPDEDIGAVLE